MHPLISYIHPGLRTAFGAWFLSRFTLWAFMAYSSHHALFCFPDLNQTQTGVGPLWLLFKQVWLYADQWGNGFYNIPLSAVITALIGEVILFVATLCVYGFCRKEALPQTTERATWLWCFCPLMVSTLPVSAWTFGLSLGVISLYAAQRKKAIFAAVLLSIAMGFKLDIMLIWPALCATIWHRHKAGSDPDYEPWVASLMPFAMIPAYIFSALLCAGRGGFSMRTLQPALWRTQVWPFESTESTELSFLMMQEFAIVGAIIACFIAAFKYGRKFPRRWLLLTIPCLLWPFCFLYMSSSVTVVGLALPVFVWLAKALDNPTLERPIFVMTIMVYAACALMI